jgi:hypothetical protein
MRSSSPVVSGSGRLWPEPRGSSTLGPPPCAAGRGCDRLRESPSSNQSLDLAAETWRIGSLSPRGRPDPPLREIRHLRRDDACRRSGSDCVKNDRKCVRPRDARVTPDVRTGVDCEGVSLLISLSGRPHMTVGIHASHVGPRRDTQPRELLAESSRFRAQPLSQHWQFPRSSSASRGFQ